MLTLKLICTLVGLTTSVYMYIHLKTRRPMRCLLGSGECNEVLFSRYARVWRVSNPLIGIIYFGALAAIYLSYLSQAQTLVPSWVVRATLLFASMFSLWLIYVRVCILRRLCEWCYLVALCTYALTILELTS